MPPTLCYKSGEAISLWGRLRILMIGENLKGKAGVEMHSAFFPLFFQFGERFNPNLLVDALKTFSFLYKKESNSAPLR